VAAPLPVFDALADWASLPADEATAVRDLAVAWGAALPAGGGCAEAAAQGLACWRHRAGSLPLLVQLDRPVLLLLSDGGGRPVHARLVGQGPDGLVLAAGDRRWRLPTATLATLWRGDLLTLWRLPVRIDPALAGVAAAGAAAGLAPGASGPAVQALRRALDRALGQALDRALQPLPAGSASAPADGAAYDAALRDRVAAFQLQAGLKPDGLAGPTTFMQLNRALAVDEPRLARE
jgi:general secretion pathway protein A